MSQHRESSGSAGSPRPNVLLILTDQERVTPPYERDELEAFRREHLSAQASLAERGVELHRHYVGSTACSPSRATLFTGQYPSLHGVRNTNGLAKSYDDPRMNWLDPAQVPTLGDWFRAAGYQTHYRGKWHISHADLQVPGTRDAFVTNTPAGVVIDDAVDAYRAADRLDPYGFSGWIGPEPHGPHPANAGTVRDPIHAEQVIDLFARLAGQPDDADPWLAVASFVNPHDITGSGRAWERSRFAPVPDWVPSIPEPPSQSDSLDDRPACQAQFRDAWPKLVYPQAADDDYRRLYHYLLTLVDQSIGRILESLETLGLADDTIVMLTSDHGELLGAHGGLQQKWHNAYDEAIHVPMIIAGPGIEARPDGLTLPTSHIDVVPTALGLIGQDAACLVDSVAEHHSEVHPLPGRDLSGLLQGVDPESGSAAPVYFMTEDEISEGAGTVGRTTKQPFRPVAAPASLEAVVTDVDGALWKLVRYYDSHDTTDIESWELHDLTADPEERVNRIADANAPVQTLRNLLADERENKRLTPNRLAARPHSAARV